MEGYTLNEELSSELWRATTTATTAGEGKQVIVKIKPLLTLSALSSVRREYDLGCRLQDIHGVLRPLQIIDEGNGMK